MKKRIKEAARYLGYKSKAIDEQTYDMLAEGFVELDSIKHSRFVYCLFSVKHDENDKLNIGGIEFDSVNLAKNLNGCDECALFAVTIGSEVDTCLRGYMVSDMAKALIVQACAAVIVEEQCDKIENKIREEIASKEQLKARFSPGYGDLSLKYQKDILKILDATKKIGVTINDEYMLLPLKSVTAIVGIRKGNDD